MILGETPKRQLVNKLVTWGHWFALCNILVAISISGIYLFSSALPETPLGLLYMVANWFSHIGFLTFFGFVIFVLPLCYTFPKSNFLRAWAASIAAIGLAFLAFDALLYTKHGLHFSPYSTEFIRQQTGAVLAGLRLHHILFLLISFFVWLLFQLLVANSLWQRVEKLSKMKIGFPVSSVFLGLFVFSHLSHVWADANLYQPIVKQDNMFPLSYPATAKTLLSKYELMNIEQYRAQKELQFENSFEQIAYPKSSLFCSVIPDKKVLAVFIDDVNNQSVVMSLAEKYSLNYLPQHFDLSSSPANGLKTATYGLPELLHKQLDGTPPLLSAVLQPYNQYFFSYSKTAESNRFLEQVTQNHLTDLNQFSERLEEASTGVFIAQTDLAGTQTLLQRLQPGALIFVTQLSANENVGAATNFPISGEVSLTSHQDFATTLLDLLGCNVPDEQHSTGQSLLQTHRNWLVSYHNNRIVILHNQLRIEIDPNGNYRLLRLDGTPNNDSELNIPLAGQAIKVLSSFSKKN